MLLRPLTLAALLLTPATGAQADIFDELHGSVWAFDTRLGMRCHENAHTIHFNADRTEAYFAWDTPMVNYKNEIDQDATYDVIEHDDTSITLYLHEESRVTESGSPVVWILRLPDATTYCWDRTDWLPGQCTHVHVRCGAPAIIS
ncbi:hypothetical protein IV417_17975 [Alphaproteobacteria bacterium KMM 3653]|uniref:Uncharacterized protein n=1 Tax=Harenicola maris TaxID=2841044 RepID=A0AAP2CTI2_9RHOB|nr:hypothetical protein [Harenicola maris]